LTLLLGVVPFVPSGDRTGTGQGLLRDTALAYS
jgi:hypothetical protein